MLSYPDFKYKQVLVHIVIQHGEKLKFRADNILIEDREGRVMLQHSCHRIFALFIIGEISLTSVMIRQALRFAFPIILLSPSLKVITRINCAAEGNTLLRMRQYSNTRQLDIAQQLIRQKIANQAELLKQLRKPSLADKEARKQLELIDPLSATDGHTLMGLEGQASRLFFTHYMRPLSWQRREPRCKRDIPNLLLDIGYSFLFNLIDAHLSLYGFDLYCGVHHRFFYQRKSLVCDIMEPFRCIIDKRLRKAHNLGQIDEKDFKLQHHAYTLPWNNQKKYVRFFLKDLLAHKQAMFRYCQQYYRWTMKEAPLDQFPTFHISSTSE